MRSIGSTKFTRIFARLLTGLLFAILFTILVVPLGAATTPKSQPGRGFGPVYDAAHETTLTGTIQEVVTKRTVGSPVGMHLLVASPQGVVDTHLGPFLSKQTKDALQAGMPVHIVGANLQLHGKEYFLARQVTVGGRTITIRSARGLPVLPHGQTQRPARVRKTAAVETKGGAQ